MLLSAAHGEAVDPKVHVGLYTDIADYLSSRKASDFTDALSEAVNGPAPNR